MAEASSTIIDAAEFDDWDALAERVPPRAAEVRLGAFAAVEFGAIAERLFRARPDQTLDLLESLSDAADAPLLADVIARLRAVGSHAKAVADLADRKAKSWLRDALQCELAQRQDAAAALYQGLRKLDPASSVAVTGIQRLCRPAVMDMRAAVKAGDMEAGARHARWVTAIDPQMAEAWFILGRTALAEDPAQAAEDFLRCTVLCPEDGWMWLNFGRALERLNLFEAAIDAYVAVQRLIPDADNVRRVEAQGAAERIARRLIAATLEALKEGRMEQAWPLAMAAGKVTTAESEVRVLLNAIKRARLIELRKRFWAGDPDAVEAVEAYLDIDPDNVEARLILGRGLMARSDYARALSAWVGLAALAPDNAHYHLQIARCCARLERNVRGREAAAAALRLEPRLAEAKDLWMRMAPANAESQ